MYIENTHWIRNLANNISSYFGLIDVRMSASDKDLPVTVSEVAETGAILITIND